MSEGTSPPNGFEEDLCGAGEEGSELFDIELLVSWWSCESLMFGRMGGIYTNSGGCVTANYVVDVQ